MEQSVSQIAAIAVAYSATAPSNLEVLWFDTSIATDNPFEAIKVYDKQNLQWKLVNRTPEQILIDLRTVDGEGSGLDADTLQGYTPEDLISSGGGVPMLNTGELLVGQADGTGTAQTVGGIATIQPDGTLVQTPSAIDHTLLSNIGTNSHAQIDTHIADTANPHGVTAAQVGNTTAQWNANQLEGNTLNIGTPGAPEDGYTITWDNGAGEFVLSAAGAGNTIYTADDTVGSGRVVTLTDYINFSGGRFGIGGTPDASAILGAQATDKGFLMPRLTTAQMNAIVSPATHLLIFNTDLNGIYRYNGSGWVALSIGYGIISVNDSSGQPTFYADMQTAVTAASSGDTIEIHADLTLAAQLSITKLLTIKMNGHTISFDSAGSDNTIYITYTPTGKDVFKFVGGGRIERTGGSSSLTNSLALHFFANDFLDLGTTQIYNDFGTALYLQSTKPTLGGSIWAEGTAVRTAGGTPTRMDIYSNNGDGVNSNGSSDYALKCTINAPNGNGCSGNAGAQMCYINAGLKGIAAAKNDVIGNTIISGSTGIDNGAAINVLSNTVKSGTYGMLLSSALDVKGNTIIAGDIGIYAVNSGEIEGNTVKSTGGVGISVSVGVNIRNNVIRCTYNNVNGHAIQLGNPSTHDVVNNYLEVANASAYGIYSANASTFVYHFGNSYKGCATKTSIAAGNSQTNTEDTIGEILKG